MPTICGIILLLISCILTPIKHLAEYSRYGAGFGGGDDVGHKKRLRSITVRSYLSIVFAVLSAVVLSGCYQVGYRQHRTQATSCSLSTYVKPALSKQEMQNCHGGFSLCVISRHNTRVEVCYWHDASACARPVTLDVFVERYKEWRSPVFLCAVEFRDGEYDMAYNLRADATKHKRKRISIMQKILKNYHEED